MTAPKTQKNGADVDKFLAGIADEQKHADCLSVLELMKELTGEPAVMWGPPLVMLNSCCLFFAITLLSLIHI